MKAHEKKTAFFRNADIEWIEEYLIKSGQADNIGTVLRSALSEYVEKRKKARLVNYFKFIGEDNCLALKRKADVLGKDFDDYIKEILISKSQEAPKGQFD